MFDNKQKKFWIIISCIAASVLVLAVVGIRLFSAYKYQWPKSGLVSSHSLTEYVPSSSLPQKAVFRYYTADVPKSNSSFIQNGGMYTISDSSELCLISVNSSMDIRAAMNSVGKFSSELRRLTFVNDETGYFNGMSMDYVCAAAGKTAYIGYLFRTGVEENLLFCTVAKKATNEELEICSNALKTCLMTIQDIRPKAVSEPKSASETNGNTSSEKGTDEYYEEYMGYDTYLDLRNATRKTPKHVVQQYEDYVTAEQDYSQLRLTLLWVDALVEPRELHLYNSDKTLEYEPIEENPTEYVYIINDVHEGDCFIFYFDWRNPRGIDYTLEEEQEYEDSFINGVMDFEPESREDCYVE